MGQCRHTRCGAGAGRTLDGHDTGPLSLDGRPSGLGRYPQRGRVPLQRHQVRPLTCGVSPVCPARALCARRPDRCHPCRRHGAAAPVLAQRCVGADAGSSVRGLPAPDGVDPRRRIARPGPSPCVGVDTWGRASKRRRKFCVSAISGSRTSTWPPFSKAWATPSK